MGIWSTLFNSTSTIEKATEAAISTGDKLFYTDEEREEDRRKQRELFPTLLKAYEPFKIAQRILAIFFSFLFGLAFISGLIMVSFNIVYKFIQATDGVKEKDIAQLDITPLFGLVDVFHLGIIMLTIAGFYFGGGALESIRRK